MFLQRIHLVSFMLGERIVSLSTKSYLVCSPFPSRKKTASPDGAMPVYGDDYPDPSDPGQCRAATMPLLLRSLRHMQDHWAEALKRTTISCEVLIRDIFGDSAGFKVKLREHALLYIYMHISADLIGTATSSVGMPGYHAEVTVPTLTLAY